MLLKIFDGSLGFRKTFGEFLQTFSWHFLGDLGLFVETFGGISGGGFLVSGAAEGIGACTQYTPPNKIY